MKIFQIFFDGRPSIHLKYFLNQIQDHGTQILEIFFR